MGYFTNSTSMECSEGKLNASSAYSMTRGGKPMGKLVFYHSQASVVPIRGVRNHDLRFTILRRFLANLLRFMFYDILGRKS